MEPSREWIKSRWDGRTYFFQSTIKVLSILQRLYVLTSSWPDLTNMHGWIYNWGTSLTSLIKQAAAANDSRSDMAADVRACGGGNLSCGVTGRWVTVPPRQRRAREAQLMGTHAGHFTPPGWERRRDGWRRRWRQVQSAPFDKFCSTNQLFPKSSFWINVMKSITDIDPTSETR